MGLDAIGIVSRDLEKTKEFYATLGIELNAAGGDEHFEATTPSGLRIMVDTLDLMQKINPDFKPGDGAGIILAFKQDTPGAVDSLFQDLRKMGAQPVKEPWNAFWGQRYASIKDPDGNQIDLFALLSSAATI